MIGKTLRNRYEIRELLGEGSTATVFKALDRRLGREVALKILLPHVRDTVRKRFFQEAHSVALLNHPNIMSIYDIDEEDSAPFLVVEYVEGDSLSKYIPSPPEVLVDLGRQIAQALHYAHERQIIHRDIKPANIKVTANGQVKIMDLGLALPKDAKRVTTDGMIIGTPAYLSPEQAQGFTLDYRTDIYSLGVVLYEMATGQLPFNSDDIPVLLMQHVKQAVPPPRLIVPSLPLGLEATILKALEKNPVRRFQSAEALAQALMASLTPERADAPPAATAPTQPSRSVRYDTASSTSDMKRPIRVFVADDHTMLRKTLINFLSQHDGIMIIGEAGDGETAYQQVLALAPDVLLLDLNMPIKGGLDILPDVRKQAPNVKVLILTGRDEDWYITQALRSGAHGYLLKSSSEGDLLDGINKVVQGHLVLGQGVAEKVVTGMLGQGNQLSEDERKLLLLVAGGYDNEAIADRLRLTMPGVIETLARAIDKMKAKDRHAAALNALRLGYIMLDELQTL
ncbi:MAG: protein kinase, partial [Anaerolinea sp.]|nr:protein kinase [Anaerolinea sp.]